MNIENEDQGVEALLAALDEFESGSLLAAPTKQFTDLKTVRDEDVWKDIIVLNKRTDLVSKVTAAILNMALTQKKACFLLSKNIINDIIKNDPNWERRASLNASQRKKVMKFLYTQVLDLLEASSDDSPAASLVRIKLDWIRKHIGTPEQLESQEREFQEQRRTMAEKTRTGRTEKEINKIPESRPSSNSDSCSSQYRQIKLEPRSPVLELSKYSQEPSPIMDGTPNPHAEIDRVNNELTRKWYEQEMSKHTELLALLSKKFGVTSRAPSISVQLLPNDWLVGLRFAIWNEELVLVGNDRVARIRLNERPIEHQSSMRYSSEEYLTSVQIRLFGGGQWSEPMSHDRLYTSGESIAKFLNEAKLLDTSEAVRKILSTIRGDHEIFTLPIAEDINEMSARRFCELVGRDYFTCRFDNEKE